MGEIADDMINGDMCQVCGVWLGDGDGYPRSCSGCKDEPGYEDEGPANKPKDPKTVACPEPACERKFRTKEAAAQHWVDKHD